MFPDMEMYRATGSVNGARIFADIEQDRRAELALLDAMPEGPAREAAAQRVNKEFKDIAEDWQVLVDRLRHQRGIPANPDGIAYRLGRFAMNLNVT
ncbi:hypothetical protein RZS08_52245, partial [Arthrospira platensis SPKY1]|nr:hypothetical protein [Arthrospira platensis SPKY1]